MGTLSAAAVVEEFIDQWHRSDLRDKMREPMATDNPGVVELTAIAVYGPHQGKGYAGRAMRMLTALCDTNGLTIKLIARPLPLNIVPGRPASLSTDQLIAWYGRYGFVDPTVPGDDTRMMGPAADSKVSSSISTNQCTEGSPIRRGEQIATAS